MYAVEVPHEVDPQEIFSTSTNDPETPVSTYILYNELAFKPVSTYILYNELATKIPTTITLKVVPL